MAEDLAECPLTERTTLPVPCLLVDTRGLLVGRRDYAGGVIARTWRGAVARADSDAYTDYMRDTGLAEYRATPGNRGAWMLRRDVGDLVEVVMFTLWESVDSIKAFAGEEYERAVFYPQDERFLVQRDETCKHYDVAES